jgi:hypothetical protein
MSPLPSLFAALFFGLFSQLLRRERFYLGLTGLQFFTGAATYAWYAIG